ncbi:integrating conjugative element protein (TIGR03756 family) [Pseudomonas sp. SJZ103]|uniref:TIGR03756 family integrating conjugative element protein n=1 Tax=unclassified Pseudomonas TaxID=196821 RepID=UPI00119D22DE|nr:MULTISPECIES: TIGR03756 family integrating conjugative element protein [unclassified Pseudomonas]MBB6290627.1 integrating conjugative element protein (TIGR03756 family) [Pseudomonas sp. SJZ073]MBB6315645.1 integrating conjugative element protein (TIGR03756 family) [Pseudomonas sp. JAI120]TWC63077.1 integrating conjugative element protein (TIGR03756 family) [Pseudomonas sp. SJZ103]TWC80234.1 integrating conjugative element protein (TIGR03756 family) [Pseudomonas sp. SJZ094]
MTAICSSISPENLRPLALSVLVMCAPSIALNTGSITSSVLSPSCLEYRVVGICFWLLCTPFGCTVKTSTKVRHFIPELVVSSYSTTGNNPWTEMATLSSPISGSEGGGNLITPNTHRDNLTRFKNVDGIGHPGGWIATQLASQSGYACASGATAFIPYYLSTLDSLAWRHGIPENFYPESLVPGVREVGSQVLGNMWGNIYPRQGFLVQPDDFKAAAVMAQRAGDVVTRNWQPHVYLPLTPAKRDGYWPPGPIVENDASTHKWQLLSPQTQPTCAVFPSNPVQSADGGYAWSLWRPYSCCKREGQIFLFSIDFEGGAS